MGLERRIIASLIVSAVLAGPATANAASTIGGTFAPTLLCSFGETIIVTSGTGPSYAAPSPGVITQWSFQANATPPPSMKLKVRRPSGLFVGESNLETVASSTVNQFSTRIPVEANDAIGIYTPTGGTCGMSSGAHTVTPYNGDVAPGTSPGPTGPSGSLIPAISAALEPDADADGFGDETQDACVGQPGPACPPAPTDPSDTTPPETLFNDKPEDKTKKTTATFEFTGIDARAVAGFECSLDGGAFAACASPHTVKVKKGSHTFAVRATDQAGNVDGSPATDSWKVKKKKRGKKKGKR